MSYSIDVVSTLFYYSWSYEYEHRCVSYMYDDTNGHFNETLRYIEWVC